MVQSVWAHCFARYISQEAMTDRMTTAESLRWVKKIEVFLASPPVRRASDV
jgi:hypothetical protein